LKLDEKKARAKLLFFDYQTVEQIADFLSLSKQSVYRWSKNWLEERELQTTAIIQNVRDSNKIEINNLFKFGLPLISNSLKERAKLNRPLSMRESKDLTDILTSFDKLQRLEAGKATDITEARLGPVTIEDLRKAVLEDKFIDIGVEDAEFTEGDGGEDSDTNDGVKRLEGPGSEDTSGAGCSN
jgi:hypothetical protein